MSKKCVHAWAYRMISRFKGDAVQVIRVCSHCHRGELSPPIVNWRRTKMLNTKTGVAS